MTRGVLDLNLIGSRDLNILQDLRRVRLLTGRQLERLHFARLASSAVASSERIRTMQRLTDLHLVTTMQRRIGGERAGSAGLVYCLDSAGLRLLDAAAGEGSRRRRPWTIGQLFVLHTLAVSELYVRLRERERAGDLQLIDFAAEPESWHSGPVVTLKPDAYAVTGTDQWEDHLWLEVDRGTESLPTLRRKLVAYLDSASAGDLGPSGVLPRVLVTVETLPRRKAIADLIDSLPPPAPQMLGVQLFEVVFETLSNKAPP